MDEAHGEKTSEGKLIIRIFRDTTAALNIKCLYNADSRPKAGHEAVTYHDSWDCFSCKFHTRLEVSAPACDNWNLHNVNKHISDTVLVHVWTFRQNGTSRNWNFSDFCSCWHRMAFSDRCLTLTLVYSASLTHGRLTHRHRVRNGLEEMWP